MLCIWCRKFWIIVRNIKKYNFFISNSLKISRKVYIKITDEYSLHFILNVVLEKKIRYKINVFFDFQCKIYFSTGWNMVRCIGNSVFYGKCTKLIVSLIRVPKPKTTLIMKHMKYLIIINICGIVYVIITLTSPTDIMHILRPVFSHYHFVFLN